MSYTVKINLEDEINSKIVDFDPNIPYVGTWIGSSKKREVFIRCYHEFIFFENGAIIYLSDGMTYEQAREWIFNHYSDIRKLKPTEEVSFNGVRY